MKKTFLSLLAGVIATSGITFLLTLAKPSCEDSPLKMALLMSVLFGQWIIYGAILYSWIPRYKISLILLFAAIGLPTMAIVWVMALWPPSIFGFAWDPFFMTFPEGYLFTIPLTFFGATIAGLISRRIQKTEQGAAANP